MLNSQHWAGYVVIYWHSNDLCAKLTFEPGPCSPHWPCVQWTHLFPVPLPLHSWMALIQTILTQNLDPAPHTGRLWRLHFKREGILKTNYGSNKLSYALYHSNIVENILQNTTRALDWLAALFLFQRVKRQSKAAKPVVSLCGYCHKMCIKLLRSHFLNSC